MAEGLRQAALPAGVGAGESSDAAGLLRGEVVGEIIFCLAQERSAMIAFGGVVEVLLCILVGEACCQI
jgi:hypothetical protein